MHITPRYLSTDEIHTEIVRILSYFEQNEKLEVDISVLKDAAEDLLVEKIKSQVRSRLENLSLASLFELSQSIESISEKVKQERTAKPQTNGHAEKPARKKKKSKAKSKKKLH